MHTTPRLWPQPSRGGLARLKRTGALWACVAAANSRRGVQIHRKRMKMRKRNRTPPPPQRFTLTSVPEGASSLRTSSASGHEAPPPDDQYHLRERLQRLEAAAHQTQR